MKTKILELFRVYERETEFDGQSINERMYNALADDLVKLFDIHNVSNATRKEVERRRDLIVSENYGIVRETMISNLAIDL